MPFLKPFGIGDLIVMKRRLLGYVPGEIAHIENVMAMEERGRYHRQLHRLEQFVETEVQQERESKRDLETTERFELENEIKEDVKTQHKLAVGAEVSGGFGPVQISAYARYDFTESRDNSQRTAQKYAKEVTERAMERILDKTRELRRSLEISETEEKNEHKFKNETTESIAGVYRWVDKRYLIKPLNYGKRLFFDVVIPEPATQYIFNRLWNVENGTLPEKPEEPAILRFLYGVPYGRFESTPLTPGDLDATNYQGFVATYGVEGVKPPPAERKTVALSIGKELNGSGDFVLEGVDVKLPDGYEATWGSFSILMKSWRSHTPNEAAGYIAITTYPGGNTVPYAKLQLGRSAVLTWRGVQAFEFLGDTPQLIELNRETGILPISGAGNYVGALAMNIEVECERSAELFAQWQLSTFQSIWTAYRRQLQAYEEKIAAMRISKGVQISGDNPERNLIAIKDELKRSFLQLWMRDRYRVLPGWNLGDRSASPPAMPQINWTAADANDELLQFVEEAFDWDNMAFQFMPYYGAHPSRWLELSGYSDPDPVFENFIKAGAAIVRIPADPKFTHAILYYQLTGLIWSRFAGDVPALSTLSGPEAALYNQYLSEVDPEDEDTDIFDTDQITEEDPEVFEVKVPTQLVWLQPGSDLATPGSG